MICGQLKTDHKLTKVYMDCVELLREHELVKKRTIHFSESLFYSEHTNPTLNGTKHIFFFEIYLKRNKV